MARLGLWMPDSKCRACYQCGLPFSAFRRRHHCRLCGQIFCANCCNKFSGGTLPSSRQRLCDHCFRVVVAPESSINPIALGELQGLGSLVKNQIQTPIRIAKKDEIPSYKETVQLEPNDPINSATTGYKLIDLIEEFLDVRKLDPVVRSAINLSAPPMQIIPSDESTAFSRKESEQIISSGIDRLVDLTKLSLKFLVKTTAIHCIYIGLLPSISTLLAYLAVSCAAVLSPPFIGPRSFAPISSELSNKNHDIQAIVDSDSSKNSFYEDNENRGMVAPIVALLPLTYSIANIPQASSNFSTQGLSVNDTTATLKQSNPNDILDAVEICTLPGGCPEDSIFVPGVVITKAFHPAFLLDSLPELVSRGSSSTATKISVENPLGHRIMLLMEDLAFYRGQSGFTPIDILIDQEETYVSLLVERILKYFPRVLMCHGAIALAAQNRLRAAGISAIGRIPTKVLMRISQCTGAPLLPTVGVLENKSVSEVSGVFASLKMVQLPDGNRPISILKGCKTSSVCTICLRGNIGHLSRLKCVLRRCIRLAYSLRLENRFLFEVGVLPSLRLKSSLASLSEDHTLSDLLKYASCNKGSIEATQTSPGLNLSSDEIITRLEYRMKSTFAHKENEEMRNKNHVLNQLEIDRNHTSQQCSSVLATSSTSSVSNRYHSMSCAISYGKTDITVKQYLYDYCFTISTQDARRCPVGSKGCKGTLLRHSLCVESFNRRLVLSIAETSSLNLSTSHSTFAKVPIASYHKPVAQSNKTLLSFVRCRHCSSFTVPHRLSNDTLSFSFIKFLELALYTCWLFPEPPCGHHDVEDREFFFIGSFWSVSLVRINSPMYHLVQSNYCHQLINAPSSLIGPPARSNETPVEDTLIFNYGLLRETIQALGNRLLNILRDVEYYFLVLFEFELLQLQIPNDHYFGDVHQRNTCKMNSKVILSALKRLSPIRKRQHSWVTKILNIIEKRSQEDYDPLGPPFIVRNILCFLTEQRNQLLHLKQEMNVTPILPSEPAVKPVSTPIISRSRYRKNKQIDIPASLKIVETSVQYSTRPNAADATFNDLQTKLRQTTETQINPKLETSIKFSSMSNLLVDVSPVSSPLLELKLSPHSDNEITVTDTYSGIKSENRYPSTSSTVKDLPMDQLEQSSLPSFEYTAISNLRNLPVHQNNQTPVTSSLYCWRRYLWSHSQLNIETPSWKQVNEIGSRNSMSHVCMEWSDSIYESRKIISEKLNIPLPRLTRSQTCPYLSLLLSPFSTDYKSAATNLGDITISPLDNEAHRFGVLNDVENTSLTCGAEFGKCSVSLKPRSRSLDLLDIFASPLVLSRHLCCKSEHSSDSLATAVECWEPRITCSLMKRQRQKDDHEEQQIEMQDEAVSSQSYGSEVTTQIGYQYQHHSARITSHLVSSLVADCFNDFTNMSNPFFTECEAWRITLPTGICNLTCPVRDDDLGSMISYALLAEPLWTQMEALWQEITGRRLCPISEYLMERDVFEQIEPSLPGRCLCFVPPWCLPADSSEEPTSQVSLYPSTVGCDCRSVYCTSDIKTPTDYKDGVKISQRNFSWKPKELELLSRVIEHPLKNHINAVFEDAGTLFTVKVFYPLQFHALRHFFCFDDIHFAKSLMRSSSAQTAGGKSQASFYTTHDKRYIMKQLNRQEFRWLLANGPQLLSRYSQTCLRPSVTNTTTPNTLLTPLYGIFSVTFQNRSTKWTRHVVALQNLRFHVTPSDTRHHLTTWTSATGENQTEEPDETLTHHRNVLEVAASGYDITSPLPSSDNGFISKETASTTSDSAVILFDLKGVGRQRYLAPPQPISQLISATGKRSLVTDELRTELLHTKTAVSLNDDTCKRKPTDIGVLGERSSLLFPTRQCDQNLITVSLESDKSTASKLPSVKSVSHPTDSSDSDATVVPNDNKKQLRLSVGAGNISEPVNGTEGKFNQGDEKSSSAINRTDLVTTYHSKPPPLLTIQHQPKARFFFPTSPLRSSLPHPKNDVVLWDQNFREWSGGLPLLLGYEEEMWFKLTIDQDTEFLSNLGVIDYSILVIIDLTARNIYTGVIDFFRPYTWDKQFETVGKQLASMAIVTGVLPTVISPNEYQDRFCQAMSTFFASSYPPISAKALTSPWILSHILTPALSLQAPIEEVEKTEDNRSTFSATTIDELQQCQRILSEAFELQKFIDQEL